MKTTKSVLICVGLASLAVGPTAFAQSPGQTVNDLLRLTKDRQVAEIDKLISPEYCAHFRQAEMFGGNGKSEGINEIPNRPTVQRVEVSKEENGGDLATVFYSTTDAAGEKTEKALDLKRKDGRWQVAHDPARRDARAKIAAENNAKKLLDRSLTVGMADHFLKFSRICLGLIMVCCSSAPNGNWPGTDAVFRGTTICGSPGPTPNAGEVQGL